ncbi:MAG: TonB-dependent receptor [Gemmatimonadetes bacterium]|jgi:hypothetical protein|nr:TonB-dependent receptor [Gemmatimonadota bacterium]
MRNLLRHITSGKLVSIAVISLFSMLLPSVVSAEETGSVSGFVRDGSDGELLIRATVVVEGRVLGGLTNVQGYYVLPKVPVGERTLAFTYIGYAPVHRTVTITAGASARIDVRMQPDAVRGEEVVIRADSMRTAEMLFRKPVSQIRLNPRQLNALPQVAESDLLRSLQSLPGVLPLSDFSSALYVRGGTPDQNLYLLDGTDVYNPEHAFGIFSTFNTDAIKQADLSKGGFGAEYGGRLSSVLDVTNLDGNREEFEGTASLSLLSAKTTLQAPLGSRGSLSGSIRRTYFDKTIAHAIDDVPDYYFYDGNLKAYLELSEADQLTISTYGGRDYLDVIFNPDAAEPTGIGVDWGNKTGSLRWTRVITPNLFGTFWLTGSRFTADFSLPIADVIERNVVSDVTLKGNVEHHHSDALITRFGFEEKNLNVQYDQDFPEGHINLRHEPTHLVVYATTSLRPSMRWEIETGLRLNQFRSDKTFRNLAPRLAVKHRLTETVNLRAATGVYYQYLHRVPRFAFTDIWIATNKHQAESRAVHAIVGMQKEWARNVQIEVEGFWKDYSNIYQFNQNFLTDFREDGYDDEDNPILSNTSGLFNRGDGRSAGLEAMLRKDSGAITGWLAYTLSQTEYTFDGINGERAYAPRHDRSHVVNVVSSIDIVGAWRKAHGRPRGGRGNWTFGANFVYGSGQPITDPGSGYVTRSSPHQDTWWVRYAPTQINGTRIPAYSRLDLSLNWRRDFGSWSMAPYLQVFNVGNRANVWFIDYDFDDGVPDIEVVSMFPVLPTFGVTFTF